MKPHLTRLIAGAALLSFGSSAMAVSYASGVSKTGDDVSFILNQNALSVQAILDGGAATLNLGTTAGQIDFNMAGYSSYQIKVSSYQAPGWKKYIPNGTDRNFYTPLGVAIDKNPASANFGKVFVSNATSATTTAGRNTPEGIYALRADGVASGFGTAGVTWGGTLGPFKSTVGPDGNLYIADLSNDLAYEVNPNLTTSTPLIDASNKSTGQYVNSIYVSGSQATGNRRIYLINGNINSTRKGLISYNLGANSAANPDAKGTVVLGSTLWYGYYPYDVARDSGGNWYVNTYRSTANQAPPIIKFDSAGNKIWEAPQAYAGGPYGIDIDENAGLVAYAAYDNGYVYIFDMETGAFIESFDAGTRGRELAFDAAGNLVVVDSSIEYATFWSPGGYFETTFGSDGTFIVVPEPTTFSLVILGGALLALRRRN
jgi:hypothetical protein